MKKENKSHITNPLLFLMSIIIFMIGIGIFAYPAVSNYLAQINQREVITVYDNQIDESHQEEIERQWELAEIYNDNLAGDPLHDPFIPGCLLYIYFSRDLRRYNCCPCPSGSRYCR